MSIERMGSPERERRIKRLQVSLGQEVVPALAALAHHLWELEGAGQLDPPHKGFNPNVWLASYLTKNWGESISNEEDSPDFWDD